MLLKVRCCALAKHYLKWRDVLSPKVQIGEIASQSKDEVRYMKHLIQNQYKGI